MPTLLAANDHLCFALILVLLRLAVAIESYRVACRRGIAGLRGSLRRAKLRWLVRVGLAQPVPTPIRTVRRAWNRTPYCLEAALVRLHLEQPHLGAGQLRSLAQRTIGLSAARETIRQILRRCTDPVAKPKTEKKPVMRIHVSGPRRLWGLDLTLVWVLGFFPVWILGVVDYHGSRLTVLERLRWPTSAEVQRVLARAFVERGAPARVLTDNGSVFKALSFEMFLAELGIEHTFTKPARPQTNGRIERIWRTFKEDVDRGRWLLASVAQLDRFCADFLVFYNRDRPHSAWGGRTPDEVYFGRPKQLEPLGRVTYFDGALPWYRFG